MSIGWADYRSDNDAVAGLLGKRIRSAVFANLDTLLTLSLEDGTEAVFRVEGDCCSQSYFYHTSDFRPRTIGRLLEVRDLELPEPAPGSEERKAYDEGELKLYGYEFRGDAGATILEFRNSSNGYYGGWMERVS